MRDRLGPDANVTSAAEPMAERRDYCTSDWAQLYEIPALCDALGKCELVFPTSWIAEFSTRGAFVIGRSENFRRKIVLLPPLYQDLSGAPP